VKKALTAAVFVVLAVAVYWFVDWCGTEGLSMRSRWIGIVYAASITGMFLFSLMALGAPKDRPRLEFCSAAVLFQTLAVAAVSLRQPAHAIQTLVFFQAVTVPPILVSLLIRSSEGIFGKTLRLPALLVLTGIPPLPGFFARIEVMSALVHAKLPWLAVWFGVSQIAIAAALMRTVFADYFAEGAVLNRKSGEKPVVESAS
jgi:hypothetical protein